MSFLFNSHAGVSFIDPDDNSVVHSFNDFDLVYKTHNVEPPTPRTQTIDIPYRDGVLDLTEVNGKEFIRYNSTTLEITLVDLNYGWHFESKFSKLKRNILGKRKKIIIDNDPSYYYLGRVVSFSDVDKSANSGAIIVTCEIDPFKYSIHSNADNWLWDSFCFETDYIPNGKNIVVSGELTINFFAGDQTVTPTITSNANMTLKLRNEIFSIKSGTQKYRDIFFYPGNNSITLKGNGIVSVDFERRFF